MKAAFSVALVVAVEASVMAARPAVPSPLPQVTIVNGSTASRSQPNRNPFAAVFGSEFTRSTGSAASRTPAIRFEPAVQAPTKGPRILCGLTIVPVDPASDAGMRRFVPQGDRRYTVRLVPPGVCGQ
jgi:hypothetical protein